MPSPPPDSRERSRSPARAPKPKKYTGLRYKEKSSRDDDRREDTRSDRRYRERDDRDRRDRYDDRRRDRYEDSYNSRDRRDRSRDRRDRRDRSPKAPKAPKAPKSEKPAPVAAPVGSVEQMIIVTVNDRLGTKAQIPCLASDPVKVFKAMVAARIGRPAHEIMLKRQGERPFKDQLTLEDYGVSNGVQIDLELDTGD